MTGAAIQTRGGDALVRMCAICRKPTIGMFELVTRASGHRRTYTFCGFDHLYQWADRVRFSGQRKKDRARRRAQRIKTRQREGESRSEEDRNLMKRTNAVYEAVLRRRNLADTILARALGTLRNGRPLTHVDLNRAEVFVAAFDRGMSASKKVDTQTH